MAIPRSNKCLIYFSPSLTVRTKEISLRWLGVATSAYTSQRILGSVNTNLHPQGYVLGVHSTYTYVTKYTKVPALLLRMCLQTARACTYQQRLNRHAHRTPSIVFPLLSLSECGTSCVGLHTYSPEIMHDAARITQTLPLRLEPSLQRYHSKYTRQCACWFERVEGLASTVPLQNISCSEPSFCE